MARLKRASAADLAEVDRGRWVTIHFTSQVEYFGIGPLSHIHMRQLHQVHAALLKAGLERSTVTSVAMQLGVWDLEAMASRHPRVFRETPVMTLRMKGRRRQSEITRARKPCRKAAVRLTAAQTRSGVPRSAEDRAFSNGAVQTMRPERVTQALTDSPMLVRASAAASGLGMRGVWDNFRPWLIRAS